MKRVAALIALTTASPVHANVSVEPSARLSMWSSDRLNQDANAVPSLDLWVRANAEISETVSLRLEGWAGLNPSGTGDPGGDIRDAVIDLKAGDVRLTAGRQIFAWGRADRINPTDVISSRDQRRLVDEDEDNRRGLASVSLSLPVAGGTFGLHWLPEFRPTTLPQTLSQPGLAISEVRPQHSERSFAARYERFGQKVDWSVTYSSAPGRLPIFNLSRTASGPVLGLRYPWLKMLGGDLATTIGSYGLRFEAAGYDYDRTGLATAITRVPRFAATLGVDRSFPGQWSVIVQAALRLSRRTGETGAFAARNATIHGAWNDVIFGSFARVRKGFSGDRGSVEVVGASFTGGGALGQIKGSYALRDGIRITMMLERYAGPSESYLGRLRGNNLVMIGLRAGF